MGAFGWAVLGVPVNSQEPVLNDPNRQESALAHVPTLTHPNSKNTIDLFAIKALSSGSSLQFEL